MHFQKTYLSREMTRAMALDHPIGDPFGGPAYGQKNGPAVAVVGAFMAVETGMALLATNALLGGMMIAGGVMSGLGAITGNKTLSQLGMVAGLVGGVGAMMDPTAMQAMQGAFSDNTGLLQGAGDTASAVGQGASQTLTNAEKVALDSATIDGGGNLNAYGTGGVEAAASQAAPSAAPTSSWSDLTTKNFFGNEPAGNLFGTDTATSLANSPVDQIATQAGEAASGLTGISAGATEAAASSGGMLNSIKGAWNGLGDMSKGQVIKGGLDLVGGMAKGVMDYPVMEKKLAMEQQKLDNDTTMTSMNKQLAQAKLDEAARRIANMKSQGAAVPTVNQNYQSNVVRQPNGMINMRPA